jgi:hypothetical protein
MNWRKNTLERCMREFILKRGMRVSKEIYGTFKKILI